MLMGGPEQEEVQEQHSLCCGRWPDWTARLADGLSLPLTRPAAVGAIFQGCRYILRRRCSIRLGKSGAREFFE